MFSYRVNENIVLRLPELTDASELFILFENNREHLTKWQDWPNKIQNLEDCKAFILDTRLEYARAKEIGSLIVVQDQIAGMCTLTKIVLPLRKAELEYWIAEEFQGKGIVTQACQVIMAYAFDTLNLNRLALKFKHVSDEFENGRSRRVAERLGFTQEGILRQAGMTKGQLMDMVMYSILADEWQAM